MIDGPQMYVKETKWMAKTRANNVVPGTGREHDIKTSHEVGVADGRQPPRSSSRVLGQRTSTTHRHSMYFLLAFTLIVC